MPPKAFLKRGEGISRFEKGGLAQARADAQSKARAARPRTTHNHHMDLAQPRHSVPSALPSVVPDADMENAPALNVKAALRKQERADALSKARAARQQNPDDHDVIEWAQPKNVPSSRCSSEDQSATAGSSWLHADAIPSASTYTHSQPTRDGALAPTSRLNQVGRSIAPDHDNSDFEAMEASLSRHEHSRRS